MKRHLGKDSCAEVLRDVEVIVVRGVLRCCMRIGLLRRRPRRTHERNNYRRWIIFYDHLGRRKRAEMRREAAALAPCPRISLLLAASGTASAKLFRRSIEAVRRQLYPQWELCIVGADDDAGRRLQRLLRPEGRIRFLPAGGGMDRAQRLADALAQSSGEWVIVLEPGDILPRQALFHVVHAAVAHPDAQIIYTDEDALDARGRRCSPRFKTAWDPDLFAGRDMFGRLCACKRALALAAGGFREAGPGALEYDFALRCVERTAAGSIVHIPRVLCHRPTFTHAPDSEAIRSAKVRALGEHLRRIGSSAKAETCAAGLRICYPLPKEPPPVSLIIPTRNGLTYLRRCVESLTAATTYPNSEIIIVDNGSDEPSTLAYLAELETRGTARILRDAGPFNYSALNNAAVRAARGEIVGLLNNDLEVRSGDWLTEMVRQALRPEVGAVGAKLLYPDGRIQHAGMILSPEGWARNAFRGLPAKTEGHLGRAALVGAFSAVTGACLLVRRSLYLAVGGLNETDLKVAFNDVDFCLRLREKGYRNIFTPFSVLIHHESATRGYEDSPEKRRRFSGELRFMRTRWGNRKREDPFYSPNLTLDADDLSLAWPPRCQEERNIQSLTGCRPTDPVAIH